MLKLLVLSSMSRQRLFRWTTFFRNLESASNIGKIIIDPLSLIHSSSTQSVFLTALKSFQILSSEKEEQAVLHFNSRQLKFSHLKSRILVHPVTSASEHRIFGVSSTRPCNIDPILAVEYQYQMFAEVSFFQAGQDSSQFLHHQKQYTGAHQCQV